MNQDTRDGIYLDIGRDGFLLARVKPVGLQYDVVGKFAEELYRTGAKLNVVPFGGLPPTNFANSSPPRAPLRDKDRGCPSPNG